MDNKTKNGHWIFRKSYFNKKLGRRIYAKGKAMRFWVED